MNWTFVLIGFALAVFMGSALLSLLVSVRPNWTPRRRRLSAASVLPAITIVATVLAILFIASGDHGAGDVKDLAIAALATFGGGFALLSWVGGLVGATLTARRIDR